MIPIEQKVNYLESVLGRLICELKDKGFLCDKFDFLTEKEVEIKIETIIDDFLERI